jgi:hypothetical protein
MRTRTLDLHPTKVHGQPRSTATGAGGSLPRRSRSIGTIITPWLGIVLVALGVGAAVGPPHATADTAAPEGTWMGDIDPCIRYRRLSDIVIPGSHDSVTYNLTLAYCCLGFAQTQNGTLGDQLNDTSENFGDNWYAHHADAQDKSLTFDAIITDLAEWVYITSHGQEIIMVNLEILGDPFPINDCKAIGQAFGSNLVTPDMLLQHFGTADPGEVTFDQLWSLPKAPTLLNAARIIIDHLECLSYATGNVAQWVPSRRRIPRFSRATTRTGARLA